MESSLPFRYGAPVSDPYFCDREAELSLLCTRMGQGIHVFVLSPRRYGKTSLLQRARQQAARHGVVVGYVNLLFATSPGEVATAVLSAVVDALTCRARARHRLDDVVRRLRVMPSVSYDVSGCLRLDVEPAVARRSWQTILDDAASLLIHAGERGGSALILDEFQSVADIGAKGMGGAFKALADQLTATSLVFSGSHLAVMEKLTSRRGAPLHGMGERLVIDVIPPGKMVPFLQRRAKVVDRRMPVDVARLVYDRAGGVPHYVQHVALAAVEATPPGQVVSPELVERGITDVVSRQVSDFADRVEPLAGSQQRILRALARQPTVHVYARAFLDATDVVNANSVSQALRSLQVAELVQRRAGAWTVVDPFLAHWLACR